MARNRKRAKERRNRRQPPSAASRQGVAAAQPVDQAPDPIEHATPDVELADAQVAVGRPELTEEPAEELGAETGRGAAIALEDEELADGDGATSSSAALSAPAARAVEPHARPGNRLINFLQGSWRELQRVQWPDRRQVIQATGVVIGFVIIAGVFLGVADTLAGKLMNLILK